MFEGFPESMREFYALDGGLAPELCLRAREKSGDPMHNPVGLYLLATRMPALAEREVGRRVFWASRPENRFREWWAMRTALVMAAQWKPSTQTTQGSLRGYRRARTSHLKNCGQRVVEIVEGSSINFIASMILRSSPIRGVFGNRGGAFYFTFLRLKSLVPIPKDGGTPASFGYPSV